MRQDLEPLRFVRKFPEKRVVEVEALRRDVRLAINQACDAAGRAILEAVGRFFKRETKITL